MSLTRLGQALAGWLTNGNRRAQKPRFQLRLEALEERAVPASLFGDFNGDGYDDLAVGAPGTSVNGVAQAGIVRVHYGSAAGLTVGGEVIWQDNVGVDISEQGDAFGSALTAGDFNGDGKDDLAVGAPGEDGGAGAVYVLYGPNIGVGAQVQKWSQSSFGVQGGSEAGDHFGWSLAAGDFNGDGRDDLAIGAPDESLTEGAHAGGVNVLYGSAKCLSASGSQFLSQNTAGIDGDPEEDDHFGRSLAVGDFNGDGKDDLAIGVPTESFGDDRAIGLPSESLGSGARAGAVHVIYGSPAGLSDSGSQFWSQNSEGITDSAETNDHFGESLAAGDFNGDGKDDLAIGVPREDFGKVISSGYENLEYHTIYGAREPADVINAGAVHVIYGTARGLAAADAQYWTQDTPGIAGAAEDGDQFGLSLAAGDFNGDGRDDLAIGTCEDLWNAPDVGTVHLIYSGAARGCRLTALGSGLLGIGTFGLTAQGYDGFGRALAVGDYDGDGKADLAIGIPYRDDGDVADAGAVAVLYGAESVAQSSKQFWTLSGLGFYGDDSKHFGSGL